MKIILCLLVFWTTFQLAAQEVEVYDTFDEFETQLIQKKNTVYVINFWATWCAPCIKELPFFEQLGANYSDKSVEVVLVSIDFKNQFESRLKPFLEKKKLKSRVIHMTDPKSNIWVDKVDPSWSGSIPATLLVSGDRRLFIEKEFPDYKSLKLEIDQFVNN